MLIIYRIIAFILSITVSIFLMATFLAILSTEFGMSDQSVLDYMSVIITIVLGLGGGAYVVLIQKVPFLRDE